MNRLLVCVLPALLLAGVASVAFGQKGELRVEIHQPAKPSAKTATAARAASVARRVRRCLRTRATTVPVVRVSASSPGVWKRSAGSFAIARSTTRSTNSGMSGSVVRRLGTSSAACFASSD